MIRFWLKERRNIFYLFITIFFLFPVPSAFCDIFMYRDSEGVLHLENKPSSDVNRQLLLKENKQKKSESTVETRRILDLIERIAIQEGVDPALVRAIARAESAFNPNAKSSKGAVGVMQLMPDTAKRFDVDDIYDPEENIRGGVLYLRYLLKLFDNNLEWVVAAYNAGEQKVIKAKGIPHIEETRRFVNQVLTYYSKYKKGGWGKPVRKLIDNEGRIYLTNL